MEELKHLSPLDISETLIVEFVGQAYVLFLAWKLALEHDIILVVK